MAPFLTDNRPLLLGLVAILLLGLSLRLTATFGTEVDQPIRADAADYVMCAYNLRHHGVYSRETSGYKSAQPELRPDAVRSPGYPLFLMPHTSRIPSDTYVLNITLAQALIGVLLIAVVYGLARACLPGWAALGAAFLTAISPHLINAGVYVLSEIWFAFLLASGLGMIVFASQRQWRWPWLAAGLLLGAATLTRPGLQYFPLLLVPLLWLSVERKRWLASFLLLVGFAGMLAPWVVRNEVSLGQASDPTLKINFLHHGMYPNFMYRDDPATYGFPYRYDPRTPEINQSMGTVLAEIQQRFATEPGRHLRWYLFGKPGMLWSWNIVQGMGDAFIYPVTKTPYATDPLFRITHEIMRWLHPLLLMLAAIGAVLAWIPAFWRTLTPVARIGVQVSSLLLLYYTAIHLIGAPFPRYSIPVLPLLFIMALLTVSQGWTLVVGRLARRAPVSTADEEKQP